ncbi:MAG: DUF721 domain-containing protein [Holosporales bacterium]|jgi:hypothetical protein|nr:DUF721 domain-containing protein [Holosporales bacterium]
MRRIYYQYKTVGQSLREVVAPICKRQGFFRAELLLDWEKIVGADFAVCKPVRLSPGSFKGGSVLYVSAPQAVAVQMVYLVPVILERIRMYFGTNTISEIKFINRWRL